MNIASDGGDEASPAAETGETARTVTIALITKVGVVGAGLRLNGAAFRLNPLRCSLELFEGMRAHWRPLAVFTRIFAAMFKICPFILGEQSDNAARKRIRGIEGLRAIAAKGRPAIACAVQRPSDGDAPYQLSPRGRGPLPMLLPPATSLGAQA
jgi:hypothetical protein